MNYKSFPIGFPIPSDFNTTTTALVSNFKHFNVITFVGLVCEIDRTKLYENTVLTSFKRRQRPLKIIKLIESFKMLLSSLFFIFMSKPQCTSSYKYKDTIIIFMIIQLWNLFLNKSNRKLYYTIIIYNIIINSRHLMFECIQNVKDCSKPLLLFFVCNNKLLWF